jgi:hypothetical protein
MGIYVEEHIIDAVKELLVGRVNEIVREVPFMVPLIEFSHKSGAGFYSVIPEIRLESMERSEKDRIIQVDVYSVVITLRVAGEYGERNCYV